MHGKELFAREVRRVCGGRKFDCVAVDIPAVFQEGLAEAVDGLPLISALVAHSDDFYSGFNANANFGGGVGVGIDVDTDYDEDYFGGGDLRYYLPVDPCDPMIEGVRQARQRRIPFYCVGADTLRNFVPLPPMPDEYSIEKIGFDAYTVLCRTAVDRGENWDAGGVISDSLCVYGKLQDLRRQYHSILAIVHLRNFETVKRYLDTSLRCDRRDDNDLYGGRAYKITKYFINPDHLYFALGELPFITAKSQMERHDPFAEPLDSTDAVKKLFTETRDNYFDDKEQALRLSPVRIQTALTYLRNLTVMSGRLIPSIFDIIEAAKGVGGNAYALRILKNAKYYPFLPVDSGDSEVVNVGIDRISLIESDAPGSDREVYAAVNVFRDTEMIWRTIDIKPDPSMLQKKKYRYSWNPYGLCSHMPEDVRIENFNAHARGKAMRVVTEHLARTEKFTSSVKDGIDIRETLRNWHTGNIYVKELPPAKNKVDTVVIIFDENHDDLYPHCTTWYAEHNDESTLSFYATGIFDDLIGPGIARCTYGGLALLFPPRDIPDIFRVASKMGVDGCAARLVAGSLVFTKEKNVAYIAPKPPSLRLRTLSNRFKKHLVWIPLSTFSTETLNRLRHFHVLNGKHVRSWATRFIGDGLL